MSLFNVVALLLTLSALFSYFNHRYLKLPTAIGLLSIALAMSLGMLLLGQWGFGLEEDARLLLGSVDFNATLLGGMLSFLLFAGSLHVNLADLIRHKWTIGTLATVGVVLSTLLIGGALWAVLQLFELSIPFLYCLLFGALISPTDPIAVLAILKSSGAPKSLEAKISGESLFNDGVGVVVFLVLLEIAVGGEEFSLGHVGALLGQEALGGAVLGLALGYLAFLMLKSVDNYQVEILITLALVTGGYALAGKLHLSGPIAVVVAGLLVGNHGRLLAMSERTREHLDTFWELVDEILNAVLFVLIGLELLVLTIDWKAVAISLLAIPIVLAARWITVALPVLILGVRRPFSPGAVRILTWGGLRGGISVALALSLPPGPERPVILAVTYAVVVFSIIVQGLTIGPLVKRVAANSAGDREISEIE